jgi:glycosyltransferase involved in cell wall biosynthesis
MTEERISVVIPTRNAASFLAGALDSIAAQTRPPDEILVIDDDSGDGTAALAHRWSGVRVITGLGLGAAAAANLGAREATGTLIAFLSADDRWSPEKLERQTAAMRRRPDAIGCITKFRFFLYPGHAPAKGFNPALLDRDLVGMIPETLLVRREAFLSSIGPFLEEMPSAYDVEWFARLVERRLSLPIVPDVLLFKGLHATNASNNAKLNTQLLLDILQTSLHRRRELGRSAKG